MQGAPDFPREWHRVEAEKDLDGLAALLADDVSPGAPPYWAPFRGRELVHHLLGFILATIEGFTYHRQWQDGREIALEFRGRVGDVELQGIDLISLDDAFAVRRLDVLIRPANAIDALRDVIAPQMTAYLAGRASGSA